MKHCPACNTTFVDDALIYCTDDGAVLTSVAAPGSQLQATEIMAGESPTVAMPAPPPTAYGVGPSSNQPAQPTPYGWANEAPLAWTPPAPVQQFAPMPARQTQSQNTAIVSLVLGIASITIGWICGGFIFAPAAVILGVVALLQAKKNPGQYGGKPMALGGLITGGLVILIYAAFFAFWIIAMILGSASR